MPSPRKSAPRLSRRALALVALAGLVAVAGLAPASSHSMGEPSASALAPPGEASGKRAAVKVMETRFGPILVSGGGRALYVFGKDRRGPSQCYDDCAAAWPPYIAQGKVAAGKGAEGKKLGTTVRNDGRRQVTYAGKPLYFYIHDNRPGQVLCQDVFEFGGLWLVVRSSGRPVR